MLSLYQKYWRTAFDLGVIALTVWLTMYVFSYLYNLATPVFLSFLIFWIIEPLARRLNRIGLPKSIATGISILFFTLVVLAVFFGLGYIFTIQITQLADDLPKYQKLLQGQVTSIAERLQNEADALPPDVAQKLSNAAAYVTDLGANWAGKFLKWLVGFLTSFSSFILNISIAIILAYFLSLEIETWKKVSTDRAPKTLKIAFEFLRNNVFKGIGAYLKAQGKLISITFLVIFVALLALGVNNAFSIALLAGIFDVLPLLGVNTLFIPWIVYLFIVGDTTLAIWLTALLLVVTLTRQFLEPRITGQTVGVSAFTMLAFMMISLSLFGVAGLILAPILMILLKALYDQGYFHRWVRFPNDEFNVHPLAPQPAAATAGAEAPDAESRP
ncbi:AI-2E family transporter [Cohnella sp. CIP 111063]|jgi:Predicted permease|uniref:AI-2E family transporter n=1 Tax=unclassified Cohnella TaxID=2636738 RepID=UPI000B8BBAA6|nr:MULTISPECIES: AI-2E family transporter [unclassified Cohnella]OXS62571.1 AI-2E family transporter [Cohnella sp. CIP 111063]PRX74820.1 sporulation integral membrane protein YtvI [Cohnella sp. SGD-V74]